jgi:excisionase family DNA binding protein
MAETRDTPKLIGVGAVAERLNVSRPTVYRLISAGVIPAFRIGESRGALRVDEAELTEWLYREPGGLPALHRRIPERADAPSGAVEASSAPGAGQAA